MTTPTVMQTEVIDITRRLEGRAQAQACRACRPDGFRCPPHRCSDPLVPRRRRLMRGRSAGRQRGRRGSRDRTGHCRTRGTGTQHGPPAHT